MKRQKAPLNPHKPVASDTKSPQSASQNAKQQPVSEATALPLGLATEATPDPHMSAKERQIEGQADPNPSAVATIAPAPTPRPKSASKLYVPSILLEGDEPPASAEPNPARKFVTGAIPEVQPTKPEPRHSLPEAYGTGRLLLTARDPSCLYAHWDLTDEQQRGHAALSANHQLLLRVHRASLSGPVVSELQVEPDSRHCFITVDPASDKYAAELGYHVAQGSWNQIAASETRTITPQQAESNSPIRFATVDFGTPSDTTTESLRQPVSPGRPGLALLESRQLSPPEHFFIVPPEGLRLRMPETLAIRTGSPEGSVATQQAPFADEFPFNDEEEAYDTTVIPDAGSEFVQNWSPAQKRALAELIGWTVMRQEWTASAGIAELIRGARRQDESEENRPPGHSPELTPISSLALGSSPAAKPGGFWFNVNAELVVYGATEPDATVLVGGRPIQLRPDGTFSCRFALPDGTHQLPVAAFSVHGEMRTAQLDFARGTAYSEGTGAHPQDPELKAPSTKE